MSTPFKYLRKAEHEVRNLLIPVFRAGHTPQLTSPDNVREAQLIREQYDIAVADNAKNRFKMQELLVRVELPSC